MDLDPLIRCRVGMVNVHVAWPLGGCALRRAVPGVVPAVVEGGVVVGDVRVDLLRVHFKHLVGN